MACKLASCLLVRISLYVLLLLVAVSSSILQGDEDVIVPTRTKAARAGGSVVLPCAGAATNRRRLRDSDVTWLCYGCVEDDSVRSAAVVSVGRQPDSRLLQVTAGIATVFAKFSRISLLPDSLALKYNPVLVADSGLYQCKLSQASSSSHSSQQPVPNSSSAVEVIELIVQDVPSPPARPLITSFTSRQVALSWAPSVRDNNSPIINYRVHIRQGESGRWGERSELTVGNSTSFVVGQLNPFTIYMFRLAAVNAIGESQPGAESFPIMTLREVPGVAPAIVSAHNCSDTAIELSWKPLTGVQLRGEFVAYIITCKLISDSEHNSVKVRVDDEKVQTYTVNGLKAYSKYNVSVCVENPAGVGPCNSVIVSTAQGVPDAPRDVTAHNVTSHSAQISWLHPLRPNGILRGYRLYFSDANFTNATTIRNTHAPLTFSLHNLLAVTKYTVKVSGFSETVEGASSAPLVVTTDTTVLPSPRVVSLVCRRNARLLLAWRVNDDRRSTNHSRLLVQYRPANSRDWLVKRLPFSTASTSLLSNLSELTQYEVRLVSETVSSLDNSVWRPAVPSSSLYATTGDPICPTPPHTPPQAPPQAPPPSSEHVTPRRHQPPVAASGGASTSPALLSLAFVSAVLSVAAIAALLYRRCLPARPRVPASLSVDHLTRLTANSNEATVSTGRLSSEHVDSWELHVPRGSQLAAEMARGSHVTREKASDMLCRNLSRLLENDGSELAVQFEEILSWSDRLTLGTSVSRREENKEKNRYNSLPAFDHSLVPVRCCAGRGSDFINASFVDGFLSPRQYIATQAPLCSHLATFWRMIWQHDVRVIVALTKLVEGDKVRCDQYWPDKPGEWMTYDESCRVKLVTEQVTSTHTCRRFLLVPDSVANRRGSVGGKMKVASCTADNTDNSDITNNTANNKTREVIQLHLTEWPHNDQTLPLLALRNKLQSLQYQHPDSPVLVHCSGGVGRTGCFIVLDAMLKMAKCRGALNIYGFSRHAAGQRRRLLQTPDEFRLVHRALLHALSVPDTTLTRHSLRQQRHLSVTERNNGSAHLYRQYQLMISYGACAEESRVLENVTDRWRECSSPSDKTVVSDSALKEAFYLPGYFDMREYVVCQYPWAQNTNYFWSVLWLTGVRTVVLLDSSTVEDGGVIFWPRRGHEEILSDMSVRREEEESINNSRDLTELDIRGEQVSTVNLVLRPLHSDVSRNVQLLHCVDWAYNRLSVHRRTRQMISHLPGAVTKTRVMIADRSEGQEAAIWCCLSSVQDQLIDQSSADAYFYCQLYHNHRPAVWRDMENYVMLHGLVNEMARQHFAEHDH